MFIRPKYARSLLAYCCSSRHSPEERAKVINRWITGGGRSGTVFYSEDDPLVPSVICNLRSDDVTRLYREILDLSRASGKEFVPCIILRASLSAERSGSDLF